LPLLPDKSHGYWAFNLTCFVATLGIAASAARCQAFRAGIAVRLQRFTRYCILITFVIGMWQVLSRPEAWTSVFDGMLLGDGGRGAGLRTEPSLQAGPLAIYLALLVWRMETAGSQEKQQGRRRWLLLEGLFVTVFMIVMTRSISVLIVAACFAPCFGLGQMLKRKLLPLTSLLGGALVTVFVLGDRIRQALDGSRSVADFVTMGLGSWRNIPDLVMISNYGEFLLPGKPTEIRDKISDLAASWHPSLGWIENTYSTFSAGASTLGLVLTICIFVAGIAVGLWTLSSGPVRLTWSMLYFTNWFLTPKFEVAGWVVLGLLALLYRRRPRRVNSPTRVSSSAASRVQGGGAGLCGAI
jgi:hypothetical protein